MATLFYDYQAMVKEAYERKRANNTLPSGLKLPSPAQLKEECLKQCTLGISRQDENIIRDFCGNLHPAKNCYDLLKNMEADKFKPLLNFLNGRSAKPDRKHIELLAWLINFPGRPWIHGKTYSPFEPESAEPDPPSVSTMHAGNSTEPPGTMPDDKRNEPEIPETPTAIADMPKAVDTNTPATPPKWRTNKFVSAGLLSLALVTGSSWLWHLWPQAAGGCMYWKEDHYQPIPCNEKVTNMLVLAFDDMKVKHFKKILRPDTITYASIGKVWYSKISGKFEYYTAPGTHPEVYDYQLKPITKYIIDKYILSGLMPE